MKIKPETLQAFLDKYSITPDILAQDMGVAVSAIETLLDGGAVDEPTALRFCYYFDVTEAAKMIDWDAMGMVNPYADEDDL